MGLYPVATRPTRLGLLIVALVLVAWGLYLVRRHRAAFGALTGVCCLTVAFLCLPGRAVDVGALRDAYVSSLSDYEGTRYVWGGENRFGIDCSGLVRKGLVNANLRLGLRTLNPRLVRQALSLWWHDCTAQALRDEFRGLTVRVGAAPSIKEIDEQALRPGDLAVTANGVHVLAYVGKRTWAEADPGEMRVLFHLAFSPPELTERAPSCILLSTIGK
jgi:cell wall-associated NlpC family hydrolase